MEDEDLKFCRGCNANHYLSEYSRDVRGRLYCKIERRNRLRKVYRRRRESGGATLYASDMSKPSYFCKGCGRDHLSEEWSINKAGVRYCKKARSDAFKNTHSRRGSDPELQDRFEGGWRTSGPVKGKYWRKQSELRKQDLELVEKHRESSRRGAIRLQERRKEEPEFDAEYRVKVGEGQRKKTQRRLEEYNLNLDGVEDVERVKLLTLQYWRDNGWTRNQYYQEILSRSNGVCYLCGEALGDRPVSRDHVKPQVLVRGASDELIREIISVENIEIVHAFCNSSKGQKSVEEAIAHIRRMTND